MKILAIETSCEHATVALLCDERVVERALDGHSTHSERLLKTISELIVDNDQPLGELDAIAFGAGPGAFTGLRLACAVAQGLATGAGIGVVPVSSLAALSAMSGHEYVLAATDARMGEVYSAAFRVLDGFPVLIAGPDCQVPEQMQLPPGTQWYLAGSAFGAHPSLLRRLSASSIGHDAIAVPQASSIARLAVRMIEDGGLLPPEQAVPLYVRNKVALTTAERLARGGKA